MKSLLRLHRESRIARIELVGPDGYPRLTASLLDELEAALSALLADAGCAGAVIHGSEKCFATGADLGEVGALTGVTALPFARRGQLLFEKIARAPKPVVAAVSGPCRGGAFDLALACRMRLAAPDVTFGHPGAALGLLTGWGGTQRLPQLVGKSRALEILLRGEPLTAERALTIGLVDEVVASDKLIHLALHRAHRLSPRNS